MGNFKEEKEDYFTNCKHGQWGRAKIDSKKPNKQRGPH